jgi:predicted transcriptional regulator
MKVITIGIMPQNQIRARVLSIAKGEIKPRAGDPKIWFTSMRSLAEVLSDENRALLRVIQESKPQSLAELAQHTGRKPSNLSRTLKRMAHYGLVEMKPAKDKGRALRPIAKATEFKILAA